MRINQNSSLSIQNAQLSIKDPRTAPVISETVMIKESEIVKEDEKALKKDADDNVVISAEGLKKSKEKAVDEESLPESIQRIKKQIKMIKEQVAQAQDKIKELEDSNLSKELQDKQKEPYQEQLVSLNGALSSAYSELKKAIEDEKLDDGSMLAAAIVTM
jgi:hypothetical protein